MRATRRGFQYPVEGETLCPIVWIEKRFGSNTSRDHHDKDSANYTARHLSRAVELASILRLPPLRSRKSITSAEGKQSALYMGSIGFVRESW